MKSAMKNIIKIGICGLFALAALASCKQEDIVEPDVQVFTYEFSEITRTSAVGTAYITENRIGTIEAKGFCWGETSSPTVNDHKAEITGGEPIGTFTLPISGLDVATTYYGRSFVTVAGAVHYGNEITFTTLAAPSEGWCLIDEVTNITAISADVVMQIADNGGNEVLEYGICYNQTGDPTVENDTKVVAEQGGFEFTAALTGLSQLTQYFVKPYFITAEYGVVYGEQADFTTSTFIKSVAAFPGFRTAYLTAQVVMDAGSETTERGICWGTEPDITVETAEYAAVGQGIGNFYTLASGLEKGSTYYMRAYAKNAEGTFYGEAIQFTTRTGEILPNFSKDQMVLVEHGTYDMGEPNTETISSCITADTYGKEPVHRVTISRDFYMCKYEVTNEQLCAFLNVYQSTRRRDYDQAIYNGSGRTFSFNVSGSAPNLRFTPVSGCDRKPASNFTWGCASQFCEWLSAELGVTVRMPTEAEWEFAARGGNLSQGYTYSGSNNSSEVAVYTNSKTGPSIVGSKKPNELGIYDMSGNVFEYCSDAFDMDFYLDQVGKTTVDPENVTSAKNAQRVIRSGSFRHNAYFRVSARGKTTNEADCGNHSGLRLVMNSLPSEL